MGAALKNWSEGNAFILGLRLEMIVSALDMEAAIPVARVSKV
jgi:hypothetical protein